jgi:hypothetical protein
MSIPSMAFLTSLLFGASFVLAGCGKDKPNPVAPDATAPPPIEQLRAAALSDSSVRVSWSLPSNEEPALYEIAISTQPLALSTAGGWNAATKASFRDTLQSHTYVVNGLIEATKHYFAIRSHDAAGNISATSTIVSATTDETPPVFYAEAGSRGSSPGQFLQPVGITMTLDAFNGDGHLLVADDGNHRIQSLNPSDLSFERQWGSYCDLSTGEGCVDPDGAGPLELGDGQFGSIGEIAADSWGDVYVTDRTNKRIVKFGPRGEFLKNWDVAITIHGLLYPGAPTSIDVDPDGEIYVQSGKIVVYDLEGKFLREINPSLPTGASLAMVSDHRGHLYFSTTSETHGQILKVSTSGTFLRSFGDLSAATCARGQLFVPQQLGVDGLGNVWVPDGCGRVQKFDHEGALLTQLGHEGSGAGQFDFPVDVRIWGNQIYVLEDSPPLSPRTQTRIQMFYGNHVQPSLAVGRREGGARSGRAAR